MGGQGLLLLMELKLMTRPLNITVACHLFCSLVIVIKNFNSRRPWPPILISHLFQHGLFRLLAATFLHQIGIKYVTFTNGFSSRCSQTFWLTGWLSTTPGCSTKSCAHASHAPPDYKWPCTYVAALYPHCQYDNTFHDSFCYLPQKFSIYWFHFMYA